jgi:hypothetical protein
LNAQKTYPEYPLEQLGLAQTKIPVKAAGGGPENLGNKKLSPDCFFDVSTDDKRFLDKKQHCKNSYQLIAVHKTQT